MLTTIDRGKFRGDCPTDGWAAVIARNVAIDAIRLRTHERQLFAHEEADLAKADALRDARAELNPEQLSDVQERLGRVKSALMGLSPHKANVVFLHDVLGHQLEEVAHILSISVAAAQSRLVRGRRQMIDSVRGQGHGKAHKKTGVSHKSPRGKRPGRRTPAMLS